MPMSAMRKGALDDYNEDELCDTVRNIRTGHTIDMCILLRAAHSISSVFKSVFSTPPYIFICVTCSIMRCDAPFIAEYLPISVTAVRALFELGVKHVIVGTVPSSGAGLSEVRSSYGGLLSNNRLLITQLEPLSGIWAG